MAKGRYKSGTIVEGIAAALGVTIEWLIDGTGPAPSWAQSSTVQPDKVPEDVQTALGTLGHEIARLRQENEALRSVIARIEQARPRKRDAQ